jgi:TadE-like protein
MIGNRTMRNRARGAAVLFESAMWVPIMVLLFMGMVELGRVTYTYYSLQKMIYSIARLVATGQATNFCSTQNTVQDTINFALNGGNVEGQPIIQALTAEQINVRIERYDPSTGEIAVCECSATGCDTESGGRPPDFVVVSLPDGYPMRLAIPGLNLDPIPLRPQVRVPYGGT